MRKFLVSTAVVVCLMWSSLALAGDGKNPTIYNLTLTAANTEYSQKISPNAKKFTVQCRTNVAVRFAYKTGYVATSVAPYGTIKAGVVYWEDNLSTGLESITLYFATGTAGSVIETVVWR